MNKNGGTLSLSKQQGGFATVRKGARVVTVTFARTFDDPPLVTATATSGFALHRIAEVSQTSFTLEVSERATDDVTFVWLALAVRDPGATVGEGGGGATHETEVMPAPGGAPAPTDPVASEPSPTGVPAAPSPAPSPVATPAPSPESVLVTPPEPSPAPTDVPAPPS